MVEAPGTFWNARIARRAVYQHDANLITLNIYKLGFTLAQNVKKISKKL